MRKLLTTAFALSVALSAAAEEVWTEPVWSPEGESKEYHLEMGKSIESMQTLDVNAVKSAYNEFVKVASYDKAKYAPIMEQLLKIGNNGDQELKIKLSREILLSNPLLDCDKILVAKYNLGEKATTVMAPMLGTQSNNWSNQTSAKRNGFDAELAVISNLRGNEVKVDRIYKPETTTPLTDLQLNWDGERILFTATGGETERWNIYEINADGSGLHRVVDHNEPDLDIMDGAYLPNGNVVAVSNIGYQAVPCVHGSDQVGNIIAYNVETKDIRRMTFDQDANWHPRVMNNGKLMYVRWEYTDLTHYYSRFVMHSNPDGTETKALYGSGGWFPNSVFDIQALPEGNSTFVGIVSGHHGVARSGRLFLFDPTKGRKELGGITQEIPFSTREIIPVVKDRLVDGVWPQFIKPWPLSDKFFLVSAKMTPTSPWSIYLVDIYDNVTLIARNETAGFISPILLNKRETPPIIPDRINLADKESTFFIQDIYEGEGLPNVPRGTIKKLRIFTYEYAYNRSRSNHAAQGVQAGWDIKRILGEVDVEDDGSAMFKVPANTPISMQPLDAEGRAVQWMRSWVTGMPGEVVSCVGCHEDQNSMPIPKRAKASLSEPKELQLYAGGFRPFNFRLEVQPILDRACIACHDSNSSMNLKDDNYIEDISFDAKKLVTVLKSDMGEIHYSSQSYMNLHPYVNRQGSEADIYVMKPYEYHASTSELIKILKRGHHNVELTDEEWRSLYTWIDLNAPMHGRFVYNKNGIDYCPTNSYDRRIELTNKYANGAGVDWKKELDDYAKLLEEKGPITPVMPEKAKEVKYKDIKVKGFPFTAEEAKEMVAKAKDRKTVEIAKGVEIEFVRIPAGTFVMGCNEGGQSNNKPASKVKIDKAFWMATTEITNQQYGMIFPQHDSRYVAEFWKDHVDAGIPANLTNQPVSRVSWNDAMAYCEKLSAKLGMKVTLPTEAQWEWACRAGSDTPMWYGEIGIDFGKYENMADTSLSQMSIAGIDPKPMPESNYNFKFWNYLLRDKKATDGQVVLCDVAQYEPNPWGLYDMHGNVAEYTRSNYAPYPYNSNAAESDLKVYRGGSWLTRSKNAASYSRNESYAWQQQNNYVGFRIIIEE